MFFHFCCSTLSEKRTLDNLNASMKAASEILERRRSERRGTAYSGSSRYVAADYSLPFPPDHFGVSATERGRPTSRYTLLQAPPTRSYRSSSGSTSSSGSDSSGSIAGSGSGHHATSGAPGTGNSLWGLLDMAQSWILNHTSRRDRSEERSRYLLRKTKQVWLWLICEQIIVYISWFFFIFWISYIQKPIYKQTSK